MPNPTPYIQVTQAKPFTNLARHAQLTKSQMKVLKLGLNFIPISWSASSNGTAAGGAIVAPLQGTALFATRANNHPPSQHLQFKPASAKRIGCKRIALAPLSSSHSNVNYNYSNNKNAINNPNSTAHSKVSK